MFWDLWVLGSYIIWVFATARELLPIDPLSHRPPGVGGLLAATGLGRGTLVGLQRPPGAGDSG